MTSMAWNVRRQTDHRTEHDGEGIDREPIQGVVSGFA